MQSSAYAVSAPLCMNPCRVEQTVTIRRRAGAIFLGG